MNSLHEGIEGGISSKTKATRLREDYVGDAIARLGEAARVVGVRVLFFDFSSSLNSQGDVVDASTLKLNRQRMQRCLKLLVGYIDGWEAMQLSTNASVWTLHVYSARPMHLFLTR